MLRIVLVVCLSIYGSVYADFYADLFSDFPDEPPAIPWKHITKPQIIHDKFFVGYHWEGGQCDKDMTVSISRSPDIFGIYKGYVSYKGYTKISTFFPISWTKIDIRNCIYEAYRRVIYKNAHKGTCGFVGETALGIRCQFWFDYDKKGTIVLSSVYPKKLSINELIDLYDTNENFKNFVDNTAGNTLDTRKKQKKFFYSFLKSKNDA